MAEHTIALAFALSRSLQVSVGRQATGEGWNRNFAGSQPQSLTGKTMLVAGLGGIGLEVAKRAHALGMKVIATRGSSREGPDYVSYVGLSDELPTLIGAGRRRRGGAAADARDHESLRREDVRAHEEDRVLHQRGPRRQRGHERPGGRAQQRRHRRRRARRDRARAAAEGSRLWKAKNIIITPHMSAQSDLGQGKRVLILGEQIRRFVAGDKLLSVVDFKKGY